MAYVQRVHDNEDFGGDNNLTLSITPAAGNMLVLAFGWRTTATVSSVTDNQGNTWELVQFGGNNFIQGTSTNRAAVYIARNVAGAATTVTITMSASVSSPFRATVHEYSGRHTSLAVLHKSTGQAQQHPGTGSNAVTSGNITTEFDGCDLFGWADDGNAAPGFTAGTGWTLGGSSAGCADERRENVAAGTYAATFTMDQEFSHVITVVLALAPPLTTPSLTGSIVEVDASAGNGSTSITVPSDATALVAFHGGYWDNSGDRDAGSMTIAGQSLTKVSHIGSRTTTPYGTGVAYRISPATGSQTFAWTWDTNSALAEGGKIYIAFLKDVNTSDPVRDSGSDSIDDNPGATTTTLDTALADLVIGVLGAYESNAPSMSSPAVTNALNDDNFSSITCDVFTVNAPGAVSTTLTSAALFIPFVAAISFKPSLAGAGADRDFTGALAAAASSMSGNVSVIGGFSGSLLSSAPTLAASLSVIGGFSGSLVSAQPALAGSLSVIGGFSGALLSGSPALAGAISPIGGFAAALAAGQSALAGAASILVGFSGNLAAASPALAGAVTINAADRTFAGALASGAPALSSALSVIGGFSGGLVSGSSALAAAMSVRVDFSGSLATSAPTLSGAVLQLGTIFFEAGLFAQDARINTEWRVVFPRQGVSFGPVLKGLPWQLRVNSRRR